MSRHKRMSFAATVRSLHPYTLEQEPNKTQLTAFRLWLWTYPTRQWRAAALDLGKAQAMLHTHPTLQTFLEEMPVDPAWDALRAAVFKGEASFEFGSSLDRLMALSQQEDICSCGDISAEDAYAYCWEQNGHIGIADLRFAILRHTGFRHAQSIQERMLSTRKLAEEFRARGVQVRTHGGKGDRRNRFADYVFLYNAFGCTLPDDVVQTWGAEKIVEAFDTMSVGVLTPAKIFCVFCNVARVHGKHDLVEQVKLRIHPQFTNVCYFDWLQNLSAWHASALPRIMAGYNEAHNKTHFSSTYLKEQRFWVGRCLMHIHDYIKRARGDGLLESSTVSPLEWFVQHGSLQLAETVLKDFLDKRQTNNSLVRISRPIHCCSVDAYKFISLLQHGFQSLVGDRIDFGAMSAKKCLRQTKNDRIQDVPDARRTFTNDEMDRMFRTVQGDTRWTLILTLLREIGLRRTALANIKYKMLVTDVHMPRVTCKVPEKGKTWRLFVTSGRLQSAIKAYSDHLRTGGIDVSPDAYIFHPRDFSTPCDASSIYQGLRDIAKAAGVTEIEVHPHAFRHTIVGQLLEAGNSMEITSKFMGHARVDTTAANYWVPTIMDLHSQMNNPFTGTYQRRVAAADDMREELSEIRTKLDAALQLLCQQTGVFRAAASQDMTAHQALILFAEQVPNAEDIFRGIVEPTCASSSDAAAELPTQEQEECASAGLAREEDPENEDFASMVSTQTPWSDREASQVGSGVSICSIRPEDSASNLNTRLDASAWGDRGQLENMLDAQRHQSILPAEAEAVLDATAANAVPLLSQSLPNAANGTCAVHPKTKKRKR